MHRDALFPISRTLVAALSTLFLILAGSLPAGAVEVGGALVVIMSVKVGTPVMQTEDDCRGFVEHQDPVVPVTVVAGFFGEEDPVGPYAVGMWSAGFSDGGDHHFGTDQAHMRRQTFHFLLTANRLAGYHGAGYYDVTAIVQDVGLQGGIDSKTVNTYIGAPRPGTAKIKCSVVTETALQFLAGELADAAFDLLLERICPECSKVIEVIDKLLAYDEMLDILLHDIVVDDPPDARYQRLAMPDPPPVLPPPAGLTPEQHAAYSELTTSLATSIGLARATYVTGNRMWGADNADSEYWYKRQLAHYVELLGQLADVLDTQPPLWGRTRAAFESDVPSFTVTSQAVAARLGEYVDGMPADRVDVLDQIGMDRASQRHLADVRLMLSRPSEVRAEDGVDALFGIDSSGLVDALRLLRAWSQRNLDKEPPIVINVTPTHAPAAGGSLVRVEGSNLRSVSAINFGPSTETTGLGSITGCSDTECTVQVPPGLGSVDVVAIGPGGPSRTSEASTFRYQSTTPAVARIYPATGPPAGGTKVIFFGSGLEGGTPYFGPTVAPSWSCQDTRCQVTSPARSAAGSAQVTVKTPAGRSPVAPQAVFTYSADAAPPNEAPVVTGVSPREGSPLGAEEVVISGDHFTDATAVDFGWPVDWFVVVSDEEILAATPSQPPGTYDVTVQGPGGTSAPSEQARFTYRDVRPTITSVSPSNGPNIGGTRVTITGTSLRHAHPALGSVPVMDEVCTSTSCTFTTPPVDPDGPQTGPVHVNVGQQTPGPADVFTYTPGPAPVVTGLLPETGSRYGGTTVAVLGNNLNGGTVTIGSKPAQSMGAMDTCSMTSCLVRTPANDPGLAQLTVTTAAGSSAASDLARFEYVRPAAPVVDAITPAEGWLSSSWDITVSGSHLSGGTVSIGGYEATLDIPCSARECSVAFTPYQIDEPGTYDVWVETPAGRSAVTPTSRYSFHAPTVTSFSPRSGWADGTQDVTITGTRLKGAVFVFGSGYATEPCTEATTCTVQAPSTNTLGPREVRLIAEDNATVVWPGITFTYVARPVPTVTGLSPPSGANTGGDTLTVSGTGLATGEVRIAGSVAPGTCTDTTCTVTTPPEPIGPAQVTVQTSGGTSATGPASLFTYVAPKLPTLTGISPSAGSVTGGDEVTVTGTALAGANILFDGAYASGTTCTRTSCTLTTPTRAAPGTVDVVALTPGGSSPPGAVHFTYEFPAAPVITSVTPSTGPSSGGTRVTVRGSNLRGAQLRFGTELASDVECQRDRCTGIQPATSSGALHIRATTPGGTSETGSASAFTVDPLRVTTRPLPGLVPATLGTGVIVRGLGGDLWFTAPDRDLVGRIDAAGNITTYPTADGGEPRGITEGPDGRMWFTERGRNRLVAIDSSGNLEAFALPGMPGDVRFVATGADGRLWFTLVDSGAVGAMTTTGDVEVFPMPDYWVSPFHLLPGADGRMWVGEWGGDSVAAVSMDGEITEYPLPETAATTWELADGPDGRIWMTQATGSSLLSVDTSGRIQQRRLPDRITNPQGLTLGPDGRMWFVAPNSEVVSAYDPDTGTTTDYALPAALPVQQPKYIAMDSRGHLWVVPMAGETLLEIDGLPSGPPAVTSLRPAYGATGGEVLVTGRHFSGATAVTFGGTSTTYTVLDPAHLRAVAPPGSGTVDVRVTTAQGTSAVSPFGQFTFGTLPPPAPVVKSLSPATGPAGGGTQVTVSGEFLTGGTVWFGSQQASGTTCGPRTCTALSPPGTETVDVTVSGPGGTSEAVPGVRFTYLDPVPALPVVASLQPASGPAAGGTVVTITGQWLSGGQVRFGAQTVDSTCTPTQCVATSPRSGGGAVTVRVTTAAGTSRTGSGATFSYDLPERTASTVALRVEQPAIHEGEVAGITARVTPSGATGTVTLSRAGTVVGTEELDSGTAYWSIDGLSVGTHHFTATYSGDAETQPSTSQPVTLDVLPDQSVEYTTTTLKTSATAVTRGSPVVLTATLIPGDAYGEVEFLDGQTVIGSDWLFEGTATMSTTALDVGTHTMRAHYVGETGAYRESTSAPVTVTVQPGTPPQPPPPAPTTPPPPITDHTPPPVLIRPASAPQSVKAKAVKKGAVVQWKPPSDLGGAAVTQYQVVPYRGKKALKPVRVSGSVTKVKVTKLRPGAKHTFRVIAYNSAGAGKSSAPSRAVRPLGRA